jgi:hypothetical protein
MTEVEGRVRHGLRQPKNKTTNTTQQVGDNKKQQPPATVVDMQEIDT